MKKALLLAALFVSTLSYAQVQGEMELGLGGWGYANLNWLQVSDAEEGIQAQIEYDFIQGAFRASIGIKAIALSGYTLVMPGVKLGKDIINLNISVLPSGLTYYGLSSRIGFGPNQQHAIDLSIQGADDFGDLYGAACLGYSYRF